MPQETSVKQQGVILQRSLTLPNDIDAITEMSMFVDTICEELGFDMMMTMNLNLAIEEAVVNVMNYAYPYEWEGKIHVKAYASGGKLFFEISDSGIPFDPTKAKEADISLSVQQRSIGGLGIYLIRKYMDNM